MSEHENRFSPRQWASGLAVAAVLAGVIGVATFHGRHATPHPAPAAVAQAPTPGATATSTDDPTASATPDPSTPTALPPPPAATSTPAVSYAPAPAPMWTAEHSGTINDLRAVDFVDSTHGWAVGDHGTIVATADGGATWTAEHSGTTQGLWSVSFVDPDHGWVAGAATLLSTDDGGASWTPRPGSPAGTWVQFVDVDHGWSLAGALFATSDAGAHWTAVSVPSTPTQGGSATEAAHFEDATHGWVLEGESLLATVDGGQTWTTATGNFPSMGQVVSSDRDHAWLVDLTAAPLVYGTVDGTSWRMVHAADDGPIVYRPESVSSPDASHVWIVGGSGLQHPTGFEQSSSDGGKTWTTTLIPIPGDGLLLAVSAPDANDAWAVGSGGTIVKLTK